MKTYIALFRGINVGGKRVLPMKELVAILEDLGARSIKTYIQSGNAVFTSREKDPSRLARKIGAAIKQRRGFEPQVLLLELKELEHAMQKNPFPEAEANPSALHVSFLVSTPAKPNLQALESLKKASERFQLSGSVLYLHAPEGVGRSKLVANAEKLLGVSMTDRNWRTVCALCEMAKALR
jgi:uncharacterized protein (DUF1697 family)